MDGLRAGHNVLASGPPADLGRLFRLLRAPEADAVGCPFSVADAVSWWRNRYQGLSSSVSES